MFPSLTFELLDQEGKPAGAFITLADLIREAREARGLSTQSSLILLLEELRGRLRSRDWMRLADLIHGRPDPNRPLHGAPRRPAPCPVCGRPEVYQDGWHASANAQPLCLPCGLWAATFETWIRDECEEAHWAGLRRIRDRYWAEGLYWDGPAFAR